VRGLHSRQPEVRRALCRRNRRPGWSGCHAREEWLPGFTSRYHIHNLVYAEFHTQPSSAILREKQLKKWRRAWKIELIESSNPDWQDLFDEIVA
jgi:predicted GIY-YIG superfamily endonuclease